MTIAKTIFDLSTLSIDQLKLGMKEALTKSISDYAAYQSEYMRRISLQAEMDTIVNKDVGKLNMAGEDGQGRTGFACDECGALVAAELGEKHVTWHRMLKRLRSNMYAPSAEDLRH